MERLQELELYKSENERLKGELNKILHPNGDGPKNPSMCDLIGFVQSDLKQITELKCIVKAWEDLIYLIDGYCTEQTENNRGESAKWLHRLDGAYQQLKDENLDSGSVRTPFINNIQIKGAQSFKSELLSATKGLLHPHIEGVYGVWEKRLLNNKET